MQTAGASCITAPEHDRALLATKGLLQAVIWRRLQQALAFENTASDCPAKAATIVLVRYFNTAGPLNPAEHYCLDPLHRWDLSEVLSLVDQKKYFLVHAPRQTGKTTCLQALARYLNQQSNYRCLYLSAETGQAARQDVAAVMQAMLSKMSFEAEFQLQDTWVQQNWQRLFGIHGAYGVFEAVLTYWCNQSSKPLVLLLDEIDALVGNALISMLRQLRSGYLNRPQRFPQSVVLCGMRHLRDYRMQLGDEGKQLFAESSPFNINSESLRLGDFSLDDIRTLYDQHTQETGQQLGQDLCERVYALTQGQPWLVNALAYDVCFRSKAGRNRSNSITIEDIDAAKEQLIQRRETHLDQLMAKLKQERVQRVLQPFLLGENRPVSVDDAEYVADLGLLKRSINGELSFSNPIYREIIPRSLSAAMQQGITPQRPGYVDQKGQLCIDWLMTEFQQFFRENSDSWLEGFQYKEAGPHLIMQAFLQRIINGGGTIHREYALGRGRTDLLVVWPVGNRSAVAAAPDAVRVDTPSQQGSLWPKVVQRVVLELKLVREKDGFARRLQEGIEQTAQYMDTCHATEGHLLLFDRRVGKSWDERIWVKQATAPNGRTITVWGL